MTQPSFQERLAALRAQHAPAIPTPPPVAVTPTVVVDPAAPRFTTDDGAKTILRKLDLAEVYKAWFAPASIRQGGGGEINMSCFNTSFHSGGDQNPQFGVNTISNLYHCHACGISGDIIDLAANYFGYADHEFKCPDAEVHEVVKQAGEMLCSMTFNMTPAGWQRVPDYMPMAVTPTSQTPLPAPPVALAAPQPAPGAAVGMGPITLGVFNGGPANPGGYTKALPADGPAIPEPEESGVDPSAPQGLCLDWRSFVPEHTPLRRYLEVVTIDDSPEEYHFWNFMALIGLICGKDVGLVDAEIVYGNLLICIVGQTGVGKSRSERHLGRLVASSVPFDDTTDSSKGIKIIGGAGSGEYMMKEFQHFTADPRSTKTQKLPDIVHPGIRGLVKWSELSEMVGKASATGATVREKVMELYDAAGDVQFGSIASGKTVVRNPFGSVITTTQPESIRNLLGRDQVNSGFLNRWIFVSGVRKKVHPRGTLIDPTVIKPEILKLRDWVHTKAMRHRGFQDLGHAAGDVYDRFILDTIVPLKNADALYGRTDLLFKKLVLLLSANMMEDEVSVGTVEQAKVVFAYITRCYESFGAALATSELSELQEEILEKLTAQLKKTPGEGIAGYRLADSFKRRFQKEQVRLALRELEELGRIFTATPARQGPGRRPKLYYIQED